MPGPITQSESRIDRVEADIYRRKASEVSSSEIGEMIMTQLKDLDPVAYVRFASVYREFKDVGTFMDELKQLM